EAVTGPSSVSFSGSPSMHRRHFLRHAAAAAACTFVAGLARGMDARPVLGQGEFRYRVVPGWGELGPDTPVNNCHGLVCDRAGHIILLTDDVTNNVIVYDAAGKLVHRWGNAF